MTFCLLRSGETGSGKSEARRLSIKAISQLSAVGMGKRPMKMAAQIANGEVGISRYRDHKLPDTDGSP